MNPFWRSHIFQMGWFNHQLVELFSMRVFGGINPPTPSVRQPCNHLHPEMGSWGHTWPTESWEELPKEGCWVWNFVFVWVLLLGKESFGSSKMQTCHFLLVSFGSCVVDLWEARENIERSMILLEIGIGTTSEAEQKGEGLACCKLWALNRYHSLLGPLLLPGLFFYATVGWHLNQIPSPNTLTHPAVILLLSVWCLDGMFLLGLIIYTFSRRCGPGCL